MSDAKKLLVFGDVHIPYASPAAVEVFCKAAATIRPDTILCLGDLLDCSQFSAHPPTWGVRKSRYAADLQAAVALVQRLRRFCDRFVVLEGNHEYRIKRWAAATQEGLGTYDLLNPQKHLQPHVTRYIPYGSARGRYPHYKVNQRIVAVHGWSYAKNAARVHLQAAQGRSVIFGHTHRADSLPVQDIWHPGRIIEARGAGCLSKLIPLYGIGSPVEWVHAFVLGYLGRRSDTLYTVPILGNRCILPDGKEVSV